MKRVLCVCWLAAVAGASDLTDLERRLDAVVAPQIRSGVAAGAIVGVWLGGEQAFRGYGTTRLGSGRTPDADTVYEIGSITKVFTATLLADAVENDRVRLDDRLGDLIAELRGTAVADITLRQLTTHGSGLPRVPGDLRRPPFDPGNPFRLYDFGRAVRFLQPPFRPADPPAAFDLKQYSNFGVGLLGYALARHAGRDLADVVRERVTGPLGLSDTGYELSADRRARLAQPYDETLSEAPLWEVADVSRGAGGLRSTARDLLRLLAASLHPPDSAIGRALRRSQRVLRGGPKQSISMNWIHGGRGTTSEIWHNGGTGGVRGLVAFDPALDRALVVLGNSSVFLDCVEEIVFGRDCRPTIESPVTDTEAAARVGRYVHADGNAIAVRRRGPILYAELALDGERQNARLYREGDRYRLLGGAARLEFGPDGLVLHAQGKQTLFQPAPGNAISPPGRN